MDGEGVEERKGEGAVVGAGAGEKAEDGKEAEDGQGEGKQEKCRASFLKSRYIVILLSKCTRAQRLSRMCADRTPGTAP